MCIRDRWRRECFKLATGTGKTVVMAMLISWQILNKIASPRDIRYSKNILIVGDIIHSRVARSNLWALTAFGANIILCGPPTLIPEEFKNFVSSPPPNQLQDPIPARGSITISRSLESSIKHADAVIVLRLSLIHI